MRVLIATGWLGNRRGGTELYALEVAVELLRRGHQPVIFSPILGTVAEEARAAGIPVAATPGQLTDVPDIIHGQHHPETVTALLRFPHSPAVFFCLSARHWNEIPPLHPRIYRYVACDRATHERLTREWGLDPARVDVVRNFVDLQKFRPRSPLPVRPQRALVFSNYATEHTHVPAVRAACEARGIVLDVVGAEAGLQSNEPEHLLGQYDLVFAKARSAIEALAVGAAVIVCDFDGVGPMVLPSNVEELLADNFGYRTQTAPLRSDIVLEQIDNYDPLGTQAVSERIRSVAGLSSAVDRIERIYAHAVADHRPIPWDVECSAAAEYLHWLNPFLKEREQSLAWAERLLEIAEERGQRMDVLMEELDRRTNWANEIAREAERRSELITELERVIAERTEWAERLLRIAEERGALIETLQRALDERRPNR